MRFLRAFSYALFITFTINSAQAVDVLFVDNETVDFSWQTLIEDGGNNTYTEFDSSTYSFSLNNQESLDYVNGFDVIVVSGSNPVFGAVRNHGQTWHAQPTPIIQLGPYLGSGQFTGNAWGWFTSTGTAANGMSDNFDVGDASSPIWEGVTLINGDTQTPDLYSSNKRIARQDSGDLLKPGVTQLATNAGESAQNVIMHAAAGAIAPGGAEAYFMSGMSGNSGEEVPFTADGETVFLNMINDLAGGGGGPTVLAGDFNDDDVVNLADYSLWRNNLGEPAGTLPNDESGVAIGETQYNDWRANYGATGSLGGVVAAVPEPSTMVLLAGIACLGLLRVRNRNA